MKTIVYVIIGIGLWIIINLVILNCYPVMICCSQEIKFKNYDVAFCDDISKTPSLTETEQLIKQAEAVMQKSDIFASSTQYKIFIKNDHKECPIAPRMKSGAKTLERIKNFFFTEQNFAVTDSHGKMQYNRPLSAIMAHQFTHIMIQDKFGWFKTRFMTLFDKHSRTKTGLLWKEEGYADYIANDQIINKNQLPSVEFPELDSNSIIYTKSWIAVKYLIEVERLKIKQILDKDLELNAVYQQAVNYYQSKSQ